MMNDEMLLKQKQKEAAKFSNFLRQRKAGGVFIFLKILHDAKVDKKIENGCLAFGKLNEIKDELKVFEGALNANRMHDILKILGVKHSTNVLTKRAKKITLVHENKQGRECRKVLMETTEKHKKLLACALNIYVLQVQIRLLDEAIAFYEGNDYWQNLVVVRKAKFDKKLLAELEK